MIVAYDLNCNSLSDATPATREMVVEADHRSRQTRRAQSERSALKWLKGSRPQRNGQRDCSVGRPRSYAVWSAGMNRVPLILVLWISLWTTIGYLVGRVLETPGFYTTIGVVSGLVSIFLWPIIFPERLQDWMEA